MGEPERAHERRPGLHTSHAMADRVAEQDRRHHVGTGFLADFPCQRLRWRLVVFRATSRKPPEHGIATHEQHPAIRADANGGSTMVGPAWARRRAMPAHVPHLMVGPDDESGTIGGRGQWQGHGTPSRSRALSAIIR